MKNDKFVTNKSNNVIVKRRKVIMCSRKRSTDLQWYCAISRQLNRQTWTLNLKSIVKGCFKEAIFDGSQPPSTDLQRKHRPLVDQR